MLRTSQGFEHINTNPLTAILNFKFFLTLFLYRKHACSRFFKILTVRGAMANASSYGFWADIYVQSS